MTFSPAILAGYLDSIVKAACQPSRYVVAFSGGMDSTALLHALIALRNSNSSGASVPIMAVYVDHGLQADSAAWAEHCRAIAASLDAEYDCLPVSVNQDSDHGPEAAARDARYGALSEQLNPNDWLLSAHHREDQAETLLINLVRGSGPAGVAGIGEARRLGAGWLVRPLLNINRADLMSYAMQHHLTWIDDPSNDDRRFDRNFLRHDVVPLLQNRWPDISRRLQRSAAHAGEASQLLRELAEKDLVAAGGDSARLSIDALTNLSAPRRRNLIRYALRDRGLSIPATKQMQRILKEVILARIDAQPVVCWSGTAVRRYRNRLYLLPEKLADSPLESAVATDSIALGDGLGSLDFVADAKMGLDPVLFEQGLSVRKRRGGEEIRLPGHAHTSKLKKLLQEEGIVPWMRGRLPLLYAGEQLVAVGDLWMSADVCTKPGISLRWVDRPTLH